MEWRCKWCGKPHEGNDPPCDNCGHGHFERAVRPVAPEGEGGATIWVCTECGRDHPRNNPPCSRCGNMTFEQREQRFEEGDHIGPETDAPGEPTEPAGAVSETTTAWVCTECGRDHPRNNPPCSRCGNMTMERRERSYDDLDPGGGGWLAAVDRSVAIGFVAAILLAGLAIGTALGLVAIPGVGGERIPADQVPGQAETAEGLDLATVEGAYVAELNDRRADAGVDTLTRSDELDREATWYNRRVVQAEYGEGSRPSGDEIREQFANVRGCGDRIHVRPFVGPYGELQDTTLSSFDSERDLAAALVDDYLRRYDGEFADPGEGRVGVDVHVGPDGTVHVGQFLC